ncbi:MAG TPA: hypothetical protein PLI74_02140, partial [Candidatus Kapabacteria bacterium]|nr:hypothetical protein [Candidatus Kapabacteria bacterium]
MKKILIMLVVCIAQYAIVNAQIKEQNTESIDEAWKYISAMDYSKAEQLLLAATSTSPESAVRAHLSLMYLYSFQRRYSEAEQQFQSCISRSRNPYPYFYAGIFKNFSHVFQGKEYSSFSRLLETMKEDNNAPGILRASSAELLAQILTKQGDIA